MKDGDWYLGYGTYEDLPGAALTFGREPSGIYCLKEPEVKFSDPEVGDQPLPGEDGIRLGRDYQRSATVTFELGIDAVDAPVERYYPANWPVAGRRTGDWPDNALTLELLKKQGGPWQWNEDGVGMMRQVWRADALRLKPGRVAWLLHRTAGRTRRLIGRPRKFDVADSRFTKHGYTPVVCEFVAINDQFYDEVEKTAELWDYYVPAGLPPRPGRPGWVPPRPGEPKPPQKTATLKVQGRLPVHPVIKVYGPCKDPKVTLGGLWAVQLALTLKDGEYVQIDARPWARTVMKTSGSSSASVADKLTRASPRLAAMTLPPGVWLASLSYVRATTVPKKGPRIEIIWRDAYAWW
ncbi:hypothetical protein ACF08W_29010 [Streptomyces sp. NPDC015144]|uniref:hypothetical protein n=1 Tax=Streptomyces sp. NPDC015144 TaxID=3364944 RepID=UPI003703026B